MFRFIRTAWSSDLASGASSAFAIQVIGLFMGYVSAILLTRVMGPTEYGVFAFALSVILLLMTLGATSIQLLNTRFVPEYFSAGRWNELRGIERFSIRSLSGISLIIAALGSTLLLIWPNVVRTEYHLALFIGLWVVPVWMTMRAFSSMARAYGKITRAYLPQRVLRALLMGVVGAIALITGRTLTGAQAMIALLIIMLALLLLHIAFHLQIRAPQLQGVKPVFHRQAWVWIGLPLFVSSVAASLQNEGATIIVGTILTPDETGLFAIAARISALVNFPALALSAVAIPRVAPMKAAGDIAGIQKLTRQMTIASTVVSAVIVAALLLATPFILLLFGPEFADANVETYIISAAFLVSTASGPGASLLSVTGHESQAMVVSVITAVVQIVAMIIGVMTLDSIGAALAMFLTATISGILQNIATFRALGVYSAFIFHIPPFRLGPRS